MILKSIKLAVLAAAASAVVGGVLFGTDFGSYVRSSVCSVRSEVKDSIPIEFQLQRARHMVDQIVPEMHQNIRLVARAEVEMQALKQDIAQSTQSLQQEQDLVKEMRQQLASEQSHYTLSGISYTRADLAEELSRRFEQVKEAETVLAAKTRLLHNQEASLRAATAAIDRTRTQKALLENQIAALEAQNRLLQAAATGSKLELDKSKLAQTQRLIADVKKQLDVAERVLAQEARFTQPLAQVQTIDEGKLAAQIDEHFGQPAPQTTSVEGHIAPLASESAH